MASRLIPLNEAAGMLGLSPDSLNDLRSRGEVYGYRDGSTWKFKLEELERLAAEKGLTLSEGGAPAGGEGSGLSLDDEDDGDSGADIDSILVSEEALGGSGMQSTGSTVIGKDDKSAGGDSDIKLAAGSDVQLVPDESGSGVRLVSGSDVHSGDSSKGKSGSGTGSGKGKAKADSGLDLIGSDLGMADDLDLGQDDLTLGEDAGAVDLDDDDDDVLSVGSRSDVTHGAHDSGIGLASPGDSGLSLEDEPLELVGSGIESFELGEDDEIIDLETDATDPDAATQLKADDEFRLGPNSGGFDDDSDSGSQVIALDDSASLDDNARTMLNPAAQPASLLDEVNDLNQADAMGAAAPLTHPTAGPLVPTQVPETPYSIWNVLSLIAVFSFMLLSSIMMVDIVRHMWSWDKPYNLNSTLMDQIIKIVGGSP